MLYQACVPINELLKRGVDVAVWPTHSNKDISKTRRQDFILWNFYQPSVVLSSACLMIFPA
jgi:hypothetical protein